MVQRPTVKKPNLSRFTCEVRPCSIVKPTFITINPEGRLFIHKPNGAPYTVELGKHKGKNVAVYNFRKGVTIVNPENSKVLDFIPYAKIPTPPSTVNPWTYANLKKQKQHEKTR